MMARMGTARQAWGGGPSVRERLLGVVGVLGMGQWERESNDGSATPEGTTAVLQSWRWEEGVRGRGRLSGRCKGERESGETPE